MKATTSALLLSTPLMLVLCVLQSVKPLQKLKRKTVYFVKTAPARLDNDNIKTLVSLFGMLLPPAC